jgi:hypothetical protein
MNYWVGVGYTIHVPREILEKNDKNINPPILPCFNEIKYGWWYKLVDQEKSIAAATKWLFYTNDKEESNIGTHTLKLDDGDFYFRYCLPNTPSGSRFWFFKLKTIDLHLEEYQEALKNITIPDWMKQRKKENPKLANASREKITELAFERLDQMADRYGAGEWKSFTPNDYFNNGDMSETPLLYRLYTKP